MVSSFYKPSFVVKNISSKAVRILGTSTIQPDETLDLYNTYDPQVELFEYIITKGMEKPWGDLYVEVVEKRTLEIITCDLSSWHYSIVSPQNIQSSNTFFPGAVPSAVDSETFVWVDSSSGFVAIGPINISSGVISMPPASNGIDGYLTATDWARFNSSVKPDMKIWQYQDFTAPVSSSVTLTAFQNGTSSFNATYIIDSTSSVTLTSDPSSPPTTTISIPAKYLPGNRVSVSSHIGTTVTFDGTPAASLNIRVYYLISLPSSIPLPADYQEDPEFLNDSSLNYGDDNYVNQNQDEFVYGIKTWEDQQIFNGTITIPTGASDGYILTSDADGYASWQSSSTIVTNHGLLTGLADDDHPQYFHLSQSETVLGHTTFSPISETDPALTITPDGYVPTTNVSAGSVSIIGGVLYVYDATRSKWLSQSPFEVTAARNQKTSSNIYLRTSDGVSTNIAPFVLPWDVTLTVMTASTDGIASWTAETHVDGVAITGASLSVTAAASAFDDTKNVDFAQGTAIQLFASGTLVPYPRINLFFARRGT